jgi:hypothetical protein
LPISRAATDRSENGWADTRFQIAIGRALRPFPRSKRSRPVSRHSAFQLGHSTLTEQTCRYRQWSAPADRAAVICFLHFVRWRSFCVAYPGSLRRVRPITVRHLTTMLPLPSVPHAGMFASVSGKVMSEFPHSNWRCVIAPRSCLLDAGGSWELSARALLIVAATLIPFWLWRSISQFRHSIVTAL